MSVEFPSPLPPETGPESYDAKLRRALTPELIALLKSLPDQITEDDIPTVAAIAASLGIFGNDPFPLPLLEEGEEDAP